MLAIFKPRTVHFSALSISRRLFSARNIRQLTGICRTKYFPDLKKRSLSYEYALRRVLLTRGYLRPGSIHPVHPRDNPDQGRTCDQRKCRYATMDCLVRVAGFGPDHGLVPRILGLAQSNVVLLMVLMGWHWLENSDDYSFVPQFRGQLGQCSNPPAPPQPTATPLPART